MTLVKLSDVLLYLYEHSDSFDYISTRDIIWALRHQFGEKEGEQ